MKPAMQLDIETLALARVAGGKLLRMPTNRRSTTCFAAGIVKIKAIGVRPYISPLAVVAAFVMLMGMRMEAHAQETFFPYYCKQNFANGSDPSAADCKVALPDRYPWKVLPDQPLSNGEQGESPELARDAYIAAANVLLLSRQHELRVHPTNTACSSKVFYLNTPDGYIPGVTKFFFNSSCYVQELDNSVAPPSIYTNATIQLQQLLECDADWIPQGSGTTPPTGYQGYPAICHRIAGGSPKELGRNCDEKECGNPINVATGNKYQREVDLIGTGAMPLMLERHYNSTGTQKNIKIGAHWKFHYDRSLSVDVPHNTIWANRPDGKQIYFALISANWKSDDDSAHRVMPVPAQGTQTGWVYIDSATEASEAYDLNGKLLTIASRAGEVMTFTYSDGATPTGVAPAPGMLITVTDNYGHALTLTYDANRYVNTITSSGQGVISYAYDGQGNLARVSFPQGANKVYVYNEAANTVTSAAYRTWSLTGIIDENNSRFATFKYDGTGRAIRTEHAGGIFGYSVGATNPYQVTDPLGTLRSYSMNVIWGMNYLTNRAQPCAPSTCTGTISETRTYDTSGNVSSTTDFNGNLTCYAYDGSRNLQVIRVEGLPSNAVCSTALSGALVAPARRITTAWHATYRLPTAIGESTSTGDRITTFTYDPSGNLTGKSVVNAGITRSSSWTYDPYGRVLTATDPRNNTTTNTYYPNTAAQGNNRGMLATVTNAAGHTTSITSYNAHGQPLSITDANGLVTSMTYDARQRLTSRNVGGETTTYIYDGVGQLTKVTMPDASYLNYSYDGAHRLTQIQDGLSNKVVYTLDNSGNRIKEDYVDPTNALSRTRSRAYDALNRMQQDIGGATPATQITQYGYDQNGNQTTTTDPLNRVTTQSYDALNRLMQVVDPFNGSAAPTKYEYDAQDNLTKVTDPKNLATTYVYNGFNELTSQSSPDTGSTAFSYDPAGNMLTKTDARAVTATYTYDALNRVTTISYPAYQSDPAETVTYTYDTCSNGKGRLCSLTDKTGTTSYSYDTHGRALSKAQTTSGLTQTMSYGYNAAGQMDRMTLPSGKIVLYTYANNRITAITYNGTPIVKNADYEPFGPLGEWTWGNDTTASPNKHVRYFDLDGRNTKIESGNSIDPAIIVYDAASRITDLQRLTANAVDPAKSTTYGYDNLDRLTAVTPNAGNTNPTRGFSYDAVGNRLTATLASSVTNYSYGATSHRLNALTGATTKTFGYDNDGNRTTDGTSTWSYGGNNRPTIINIPGTSLVVQSGINALGQRVTKTVNGIVTRFMYDEAGRLIGEYDLDGKPQQETLWFNDLPVAVIK